MNLRYSGLHNQFPRLFLFGWLLNSVTTLSATAQSNTFIDRWKSTDLRVASYNVYFDSIFATTSIEPLGYDPQLRFQRMIDAIQPDILGLQEIYNHTAAETADLLNALAPLPGNETWHTLRRADNVIASRFPLAEYLFSGSHSSALVDLPDERFDVDFFVLNDHWRCCNAESSRQRSAARMVAYLDDARTPGGRFDLPGETPFAVIGDLNIVSSGAPLETILTGEGEGVSTPSPPDWDGTPITDARPLQNSIGPETFTWRDDQQRFDPGVLDFILYSDSVLNTANSFVLNTDTMTDAQLLAAGLQRDDVKLYATRGIFDHLPVVVDFRFPVPEPMTLAGALFLLASLAGSHRFRPTLGFNP